MVFLYIFDAFLIVPHLVTSLECPNTFLLYVFLANILLLVKRLSFGGMGASCGELLALAVLCIILRF